jgi:hypothetical protein
MTNWLERSGQDWKRVGAHLGALVGVPSTVLGFVFLRELWVLFVLGLVMLLANLVFPLLIRCRVCGLHLESSTAARSRARSDRLKWVVSLDSCPACGDDGASSPSTPAWGRLTLRERPYWSVRRILTASFLTLLLLGGAVAIGALYRIRP